LIPAREVGDFQFAFGDGEAARELRERGVVIRPRGSRRAGPLQFIHGALGGCPIDEQRRGALPSGMCAITTRSGTTNGDAMKSIRILFDYSLE